jgi:hypothetical protein
MSPLLGVIVLEEDFTLSPPPITDSCCTEGLAGSVWETLGGAIAGLD